MSHQDLPDAAVTCPVAYNAHQMAQPVHAISGDWLNRLRCYGEYMANRGQRNTTPPGTYCTTTNTEKEIARSTKEAPAKPT